MSRLPTQENCNPNDPEQALAWITVGLPFFGQTPFMLQDTLRPQWSKLWTEIGVCHVDRIRALADENGMIHVDQLPRQSKKYRPPFRGQQHSLNGSGGWVDIDEPDLEPVTIPDPAQYTPHEQAVMLERLYYTGMVKPESEPVDGAETVSGPLFQPSEHSPSTVNGYLMGVSQFERRRVIAAEMTGKRRDQILRKWKGV